MNFKVNSEKTAAVATDVYWLPINKDTPRGVKVLLLTEGGVATIGQYSPQATWIRGWFPMPKTEKTK